MALAQERKVCPDTKYETQARQDEVYRLYFDYGHSARKIADLMKINQKTINADIDFLCRIIVNNYNLLNSKTIVSKQLRRLEIQKTRLRESLDKTQKFSEKMAINKFLFDMDYKIMQIRIKITTSNYRVHELCTQWLNKFSKNHGQPSRYYRFFDTLQVSIETSNKIKKLIKEDPYRIRSQ